MKKIIDLIKNLFTGISSAKSAEEVKETLVKGEQKLELLCDVTASAPLKAVEAKVETEVKAVEAKVVEAKVETEVKAVEVKAVEVKVETEVKTVSDQITDSVTTEVKPVEEVKEVKEVVEKKKKKKKK